MAITGSVGCYYEYLHRIAFVADLVIFVTALVRYPSRTPTPTQSFYIKSLPTSRARSSDAFINLRWSVSV